MALHSQGFRFSKRVNKLEQQGKAYSNLGNTLDSLDGSQYKSVANTVLSGNPKPSKRAKVKDTKTRPNNSATNRQDPKPHGVRPPLSNDDLPLKKFPPPPPTKLDKTSLPPPLSIPFAFAEWSISPNRMHQQQFPTQQSTALWFSPLLPTIQNQLSCDQRSRATLLFHIFIYEYGVDGPPTWISVLTEIYLMGIL